MMTQSPNVPAVKSSPANIQYLSFQGGGGKGLAYLGALQWLENNNAPLPLFSKSSFAGQNVSGVSGASAGAITALLVALGYSSGGIQSMLQAATGVNGIIDGPELGSANSIPADMLGATLGESGIEAAIAAANPELAATIAVLQVPVVAAKLRALLKKAGLSGNELAYALITNPIYWACLVSDGGFLSGKKLRAFLGAAIANSTVMMSQSVDVNTVTFLDLFNATRQSMKQEVQLAVVGTNLRTNRPMLFSKGTTPLCPVVDAVTISASFPFLFKPTWISTSAKLGAQQNAGDYVGWFCDGGLTNNIPIHAFDFDPPLSDAMLSSADPNLRVLNPRMLGLRLAAGDAPKKTADPPRDPSRTEWIWEVLGDVLDSLQYGANGGQMRSPLETAQTVVVYSDGAGLTDFSLPDSQTLQQAMNNGATAMEQYYGSS